MFIAWGRRQTFLLVAFFFFAIELAYPGGCSSDVSVSSGRTNCSAIFGGNINEHNSAVGALVDSGNNVFCSATLISGQWVLTAAHCVHGKKNSAFRFAYAPEGNVDSAETYSIQKSVVHPLFEDGTFVHDLAMLQLEQKVQTDMEDMKVETVPNSLLSLNIGQMATFVGLGEDNTGENGIRHEISLPLVSVSSAMFSVAYDDARQGGACFGDSGGAVFINIGGNQVLSGIVSSLISDSAHDGLCIGTYSATRVDRYLDWIRLTMGLSPDFCNGDDGKCLCPGACVDGVCRNERCQSLTCNEGHDCLSQCSANDGSCMNECFVHILSLELEMLSDFLLCGQDYCALYSSAELSGCLLQNCTNETISCFHADQCTLIGGDCKFGTACVPGQLGLTFCRFTEQKELTESCVPYPESDELAPNSVSCMDGMVCALDGNAYLCQKICREQRDCPIGMYCQSGLYSDLHPDLGICVMSENAASADNGCSVSHLAVTQFPHIWTLIF